MLRSVPTEFTEDSISTFAANGELAGRVWIGYDRDLACCLVAGFSPQPPLGEPEFYFHLLTVDTDDGSERVIFASSDAANLIGRADKMKVRGALLLLAARLLAELAPESFTMATYTAHLPDRALRKFGELCALFAAHGYQIQCHDPYHGRHMWRMVRMA